MEITRFYDHRRPWFPHRDSRTEGWAFVGNPVPIAILTVLYVYFVKVGGPRWMRNRKPFELQPWILVYNFLASALSLFFLCLFFKYAYVDNGYRLLHDIDLSDRTATIKIVHLSWWFYMFKLVELVDTVFFVLRKKFNQVSALHVFHHVVVSWNLWLSVTYAGQAHAMFITCLNSFVHVIMYAYYFLAALGPSYRGYLWWKKYLTMLQIVQFILHLIHCIFVLFAEGNHVPLFCFLSVLQGIVFFVWFVVFYLDAYSKRYRASAASVDDKKAE